MKFNIQSHVWGGITGERFGLVKNDDDTLLVISDRDEAEKYANDLNKSMNNSRAKANFNYTVVPAK